MRGLLLVFDFPLFWLCLVTPGTTNSLFRAPPDIYHPYLPCGSSGLDKPFRSARSFGNSGPSIQLSCSCTRFRIAFIRRPLLLTAHSFGDPVAFVRLL